MQAETSAVPGLEPQPVQAGSPAVPGLEALSVQVGSPAVPDPEAQPVQAGTPAVPDLNARPKHPTRNAQQSKTDSHVTNSVDTPPRRSCLKRFHDPSWWARNT
ncbi:hypothetical protein GCM10022247_03210 [Allokutzneria multivorans]|uniref:Uncharacterized protein n=1 Tax=Allokutzneria multivorans TaxID=1142134 RepID=A0ABP7QUC7_9PSEU